MTPQSKEKLREILNTIADKGLANQIYIDRDDYINQAIAEIEKSGFIHRDEVRVDEDKVKEVLNKNGIIFNNEQYERDIAHALSQADIIKGE